MFFRHSLSLLTKCYKPSQVKIKRRKSDNGLVTKDYWIKYSENEFCFLLSNPSISIVLYKKAGSS